MAKQKMNYNDADDMPKPKRKKARTGGKKAAQKRRRY